MPLRAAPGFDWRNGPAGTLFRREARLHRDDLTRAFVKKYGYSVHSGPFKGMVLAEEASWGDGDRLPKLLGSYEMELHDVVQRAVGVSHDVVVNIGCAEGYYAVGMAMLLPGVMVHGFDIDVEALRICRLAAVLNSVDQRVATSQDCGPENLHKLLDAYDRPFLIVDCEGTELALLKPDLAPSLNKADMLIECHDFRDRDTTGQLLNRFRKSHEITLIKQQDRSPSLHPFLETLPELSRLIATCEFRPELMHWLHCTVKMIL